MDRLRAAKVDMSDTLLWWIALGYDTPHADRRRRSRIPAPEPEKIVAYWNKLKDFPGVYGEISFTPDEHNGYPDRQIVMVEANSLKEGAFNLAPGYGAA